jgi:GNAT superfamily N-acetyltransferase
MEKQPIDKLSARGRVGALWFKILARSVYRREILIERPLSDPIPEINSSLLVDIALLQTQEIAEYFRFRPNADLADIGRRVDRGHCCFVARCEGRIVSASWTTTEGAWSSYLGREIVMTSGDVYTYDSFTDPDFRGQQVATVRLAAMLRFFREAGYVRLVSIIVPENSGALRPPEKMGYHPFGVIGYFKLGPWRWEFCRIKRGARPLRLSSARNGRG